jgi:hypothetical protein
MPPTPDDVRRIITEAVSPARFFVGPSTRLEWEHTEAEDVSWEVFRGRLLDPAHTRQRRTFESWNIYLLGEEGRSSEPLLSVKWDAAGGEIHVVRAILSYAHEGYDSGGNVILTREVRKWVRELVGTNPFPLRRPGRSRFVTSTSDLLFRAVVGTRLPLTSIEAPLPAFSLGELGYFPATTRSGTEPMTSCRELIAEGLTPEFSGLERVKLLELVLRAAPPAEVATLARLYADRDDRLRRYQWAPDELRCLFNEVSLSPYTDFVAKALLLVKALEQDGCLTTANVADFLGRLLRQTGRHLTAYDLIRFHHAGANYPDALLLDAVMREYLDLIQRQPQLFFDTAEDDEPTRKAKHLRRRGLRQGWLIRQRYRGHAVPDAPTSLGENARILPSPHVRIPEEQIMQLHRRTKHLFEDELPVGEQAREVLRQSVRDLEHPNELRELGTALYLDRPLGSFKVPGEPDQTPLFSYETFSRSLAMRQLLLIGEKNELMTAEELATLRQALQALPVSGVPVAEVSGKQRPGVVTLADAGKAADDFLLLKTTRTSSFDFFTSFQIEPLMQRFGMAHHHWEADWLILGSLEKESGEILITVREAGTLRNRLELSANPRDGYGIHAGVEYPRKGLRVRRVWENTDTGDLHQRDLSGEELFVLPG